MGCALSKGFYAFFVVLLICGGCGPRLGNVPKHPGYMDSLLQKFRPDYSDSIGYFRLVDSLYRSIAAPDKTDLWDAYSFKLSYFYYHRKDYSRALPYTDTLLQVIGDKDANTQNSTLYAKAMFVRGNLLLEQSNYKDAYDCYYQARQQIMRTGDSCAFAEYSHTLARVCFQQQKYLEAAHYYQSLLVEESQCYENDFQFFANKQGTMDNVALCYSRAGLLDSADDYFDAALQYIDQNAARFTEQADYIPVAKAVIWGNRAETAILRGNDSAAERLLLQGININRLPQHAPEDAVYSRIKLAKLYLKHNDLLLAGKVLADCKIALDTIRNNDLNLKLYNLQSRYAAAARDTTAALVYLTKYIQQKDSLASLAPPITSADVHATFEEIGRKSDLLLLQQKSKTQQTYIIVLLLLGVMAAVIILLVLRNSRQSKKHIRTLGLTLEVLEKSQEDNSRLVNAVAHDLRGPIGAMANFAKLTLDETPEDSPVYKFLGVMYRTGKSALELITDLLHVQTSSGPLQGEQLDLEELLQYCVTILQHKASEKQQQIMLHTLPAKILGDREKLWRVFSNLISNAIKFSGERALITIRIEVKENNILVSVQDNGIGIPAEIRDSVFDLSGKAKRKGTAGEASFGLGLVICKQIVELHNGKIWFATQQGSGTTFYVQLPAGET